MVEEYCGGEDGRFDGAGQKKKRGTHVKGKIGGKSEANILLWGGG